jgi:60 kDa SS-A/Ro ribonucleoprotein
MANKQLFRSLIGKLIPATDTINHEGALAYSFEPKQRLAQYIATGCLNGTFYATGEEQLTGMLDLCGKVEPHFIAQMAVYARKRGFMKDTPALLCAVLATKDLSLLQRVYPRVMNNGRMVRNFVQIIRSGVVGRKSLGTAPKRLIREWLSRQTPEGLFRASVGQDPSLADIIKMVHPTPESREREALYGYLIGRPHDPDLLPEVVKVFEAFKRGDLQVIPDVPFEMLTALPLGSTEWIEIARRGSWQMTRMNLNTFARHGVFEVEGLSELIAARLRDPEAIAKARVFPYQLLAAFINADEKVPQQVREALQDAMEQAIGNVPALPGKIYVCPDVSGSMSSPITGYRKRATSAVRCIDVAALIAAAVVRKNPAAEVLPFENDVVSLRLNSRDSVMTNAARLASIGGGGTNCSAPLALMNACEEEADLVVFVSDNQSWVDAGPGRGTKMMRQWEAFLRRNPSAKLVCIDLQPYGTTQAAERADILNIGGFSDQVFETITLFAAGRLSPSHWVGEIEAIAL